MKMKAQVEYRYYDGTYQGEIEAPKNVIIDGLYLYNVAKIAMLVNYHFSNNVTYDHQEFDLEVENVTFLDSEGNEIAETNKLTESQLKELGFPYDQEYQKALRGQS